MRNTHEGTVDEKCTCPGGIVSGAVCAQDDLKVSVEPFQFGKKAPMKQCPKLELWHIPGDVYVWATPDGVVRYPPEEGGKVELCNVTGSNVAKNRKMAVTPLQYQKSLQSYIAVVRKPDAPWMRKTASGIELVPGEKPTVRL